jgi:membrane-bound hydrogenase subunit beta
MTEENIKRELEEKFPYLKDAVTVPRRGRIFAEVPLDKFDEVFTHAVKQLNFFVPAAITGLDTGTSFEVLYHLGDKSGTLLNLSVTLNRENPAVKTITSMCPSADIYERELEDLLGIKVIGLAPGSRYPLPDNWPKGDYPLRKDWKDHSHPEEAKHA